MTDPARPEPLTFSCGPSRVVLNADGEVVDLRHEDRPDLSYLTASPPTDAAVTPGAGEEDHLRRRLRWQVVDSRRDVDEYEVMSEALDPTSGVLVRKVQRHSFTAGWTTRIVWTHASPRPMLLEAPGFAFTAGPGCLAWGLAAAEDTACAVLPLLDGPVLGGRLWRGSGAAFGPGGLTLQPVTLHPGEQLAAQWEWGWYATASQFARHRHPGVPWALTAWDGESVEIDTGPDTVVLVNGRPVDQQEGARIALEDYSGSLAVELRSARGTATYSVSFTRPAEELVDEVIREALDQPRAATGVPRLSAASVAVLLQNALVTDRWADRADAEDALDSFTARQLDEVVTDAAGADAAGDAPVDAMIPPDPVLALLLATGSWRTSDAALFDAAEQVLLNQRELRPGLGLALLDLTFAWWARNQQPASWTTTRVREHLAALYANRDTADRSCAAVAAAVELGQVLGKVAEPADLHTLGVWLGAGLIGGPLTPIAPLARAQALAALRLLPESEVSALVSEWNCSLAELADRAAPQLVRDLVDRSDASTAQHDDSAQALVFLQFGRS